MKRLIVISLAVVLFLSLTTGLSAQRQMVEYSFAPPHWQSTICLPDDPYKTLVDEQGNLMIHSNPRIQNGEPGTLIGIEVVKDATWFSQRMESARIPIVVTTRQYVNISITEDAFAITRIPEGELKKARPLDPDTLLSMGEGMERPRNDAVLYRLANGSGSPRTVAPILRIQSRNGVRFENDRFILNNREEVACTLPFDPTTLKTVGNETTISLKPFTVESRDAVEFALIVYGGGAIARWPVSLNEVKECRSESVRFWKSAELPYDRIEVPDQGIQDLLDASVRNIWQSREIKKGLPAFQVGPTCYRGLWIVDGAFLLEAATILGTGEEARNGVAYNLSFQKEDGRFEVMDKYWKENGIITWTAVRHALLTQDKEWLGANWNNLERAMDFMVLLRDQTKTDNYPLNDGLMPAGTIDGGLSFGQEYTNVYWNLLGLKAFLQAAEWLGKTDAIGKWKPIYEDFYQTFREAARRDMLKDPAGNSYLPILMGPEGGSALPQKAQWAFCQAVYPGQIFERGDSLVLGNLSMLEATEREGMVYGTGWDSRGLWNYFASFYGHAWLWEGNGAKAARILYSFANHASPLLAWREEQSLKGEPYRKVGDMPHNWASAEFIRLAVHLLALDRGNEMHLLEGIPADWLRGGMTTRLDGIATPFGPIKMEVKVSGNGKTATLKTEPLADPGCARIVVHLDSFGQAGQVVTLDPKKENKIEIEIKRMG